MLYIENYINTRKIIRKFHSTIPNLRTTIMVSFSIMSYSQNLFCLQLFKTPVLYSVKCTTMMNITWKIIQFMMTSSNGNIFHIIGQVCEEFTGHLWIPRTKASDAQLGCFFHIYARINAWVNNREAGDLRRHRAHYDVIVLLFWNTFNIILLHCRIPGSPLTRDSFILPHNFTSGFLNV